MEKALALSSTNLHSQQYTAKLNLLAQEAQGY
jgi:hypothetical protein